MKHSAPTTSLALMLVLAVSATGVFAREDTTASAPGRKVVTTQADLPRHSYVLTTKTASALLDDDAAFNALAAHVLRDTEATLRDYDIRDQNAKGDLYVVLRNLALLRSDAEAERVYGEKIRATETKLAARLTDSLMQDAAAVAASASPDKRAAAYRQALAKAIDPMPFPVVRETLTQLKSSASTPNAATLVRARVESRIDPVADASRRLSDEQAYAIIGARMMLKQLLQYNQDTVAVLGGYIERHQAASTDIWPARSVTLSADQPLHPVRLAVWDDGVDVTLFPGRLFVNDKEKPDGRDDDGNGYVDDVHGISFDEREQPSIGPLRHFDDVYPGREAELREFNKGRSDAGNDRPTAAATAYRQRVASLKPAQVAPLMEAAGFYGAYSHGTYVAGIAMAGNPAARLLVVRRDSDGYHTKLPAMTEQTAAPYLRNVRAIVAYLRAQHVRVVNMSWGTSVADIEQTLEANNIGATPAERSAMALKTMAMVHKAFAEAMHSAPGILFVAAAGNSNTNLDFAPDLPAGINLPNVLSVGAVDTYGDATSFSSFGKQVTVYANGYEVDGIVPGGFHTRGSGTSAAAPQVTNLAAKLFALKPSLTAAECAALIKKGTTPSADGKHLLLDPRNTVALLKQTYDSAEEPEKTP